MKRSSRFAVVPVLLLLLGACSGSNNNDPPDGSTNPDGGLTDPEGGSGPDTGNPGTEYDAELSAAQIAGPRVTTSAKGSAKFFLGTDGQTLQYQITQNVANAQAVNLHIGAPLENGAVTHQLTPVSGNMTGTVTLNAEEQAAISADQIYVDVTSAANPGGEIRGQITLPGTTILVAVPTGAQQVPPVNSQYTAHASFILSADQTSLISHVSTTAIPTNVLLEVGVGGTNGSIAYPLTPPGQLVNQNVTLSSSDAANLTAGMFYVNIQTAQNPAGEVRGQIVPIGSALYTGILEGSNEVPPVTSAAAGGAQLVVPFDQKTANYTVAVTGIIPTGIEIDNAPEGANGQLLYQLTLNQTGASGTLNLSGAALGALNVSAAYVNVKDVSYANGELRTQLKQQ